MNLLEKKYWWLWIILLIITGGASSIALAALLGVLDDKAWYANYKNWLLGLVCFIFPFFIMLSIFTLQTLVLSAAKLNVPGKEFYLSPYIWILCLIIPIIGWTILTVLIIYLGIGNIVMLSKGYGK